MDLMARRRAIMGMPSGKDYTVSGNVISISNALAKNAKSAIVTFLPKQSGSGDPSPNNVRPISGYTDISAVRYGKNLWSMTACVGCSYNPAQGTVFDTTPATLQPTDNGDGSFSATISSWGRVCFIVPVPSGASVRSSFSRSGAGGRRTIGWLDADKKVIGSNYNNTSASETYDSTWTATGEAKYLFFVFTSNTASTQTITYPQVEIGYTATSYEPYISPSTASVHSDTTIFGGTVDLVSGELVVDRACMVFNGTQSVGLANWRGNSSSSAWLYRIETTPNLVLEFASASNLDNIWCDRLLSVQYGGNDGLYGNTIPSVSRISGDLWGIGMRVADTSLTTENAINTWLAANPVTVVYKLATPVTYHLTPSQLAMLKGNNTVYSNEGSISLTYVGK